MSYRDFQIIGMFSVMIALVFLTTLDKLFHNHIGSYIFTVTLLLLCSFNVIYYFYLLLQPINLKKRDAKSKHVTLLFDLLWNLLFFTLCVYAFFFLLTL